jgi:hypothetical protein
MEFSYRHDRLQRLAGWCDKHIYRSHLYPPVRDYEFRYRYKGAEPTVTLMMCETISFNKKAYCSTCYYNIFEIQIVWIGTISFQNITDTVNMSLLAYFQN